MLKKIVTIIAIITMTNIQAMAPGTGIAVGLLLGGLYSDSSPTCKNLPPLPEGKTNDGMEFITCRTNQYGNCIIWPITGVWRIPKKITPEEYLKEKIVNAKFFANKTEGNLIYIYYKSEETRFKEFLEKSK